jgi:DNA polymerase (family 10)
MVNNKEVRQRFQLFAELLQLHEADEDLSKALAGASYRISQMSEQLIDLDLAELKKQFRSSILKLIIELKENGTIGELDELIQLTPSGVFEMMRIKGLGGKKLSALWKSAGIDSIDKLLVACKNGEVSQLSGFGAKTEKNIIAAIEELRSSEKFFHYGFVADDALAVCEILSEIFKDEKVSLCGDIRRKTNTVEGIEILTTIRTEKIIASTEVKKFLIAKNSEKDVITGHTINEIPVTIYHCNEDEFAIQLFKRTGTEKHVEKVLKNSKAKKYTSEEDIYAKSGYNFVEPELREDIAEWTFADLKSKLRLVTNEDIRGVVHNHTTWSDGIDPVKDFVNACKKKKYEYVVISDHSKNAHYAGGLKEDQVLKQHKEIDELNQALAPFRIFKSIECDILISGDLDYGNDFLKVFDLVIISVHQLLKMDEERATNRLIKAIENPYTRILGHMTGRQLLIRPGYPVDHKKVIDACAANDVIIEINANPYRLDMDWKHIPYALEKGVMISVNPDAHSISEIENIRWGVESARKGGLTREMTWNAQPLDKIEKWLKKKNSHII